MEDNVYAIALKAIKAVGSRDPFEVADYLGILAIHISGSLLGYAALYNNRYPAIGLNIHLDPPWWMFGGWHEIGHVLYGDIFDKLLQQGGIMDTGFCTQEVDSKTIARHEKRTNLLSADVCLLDEDVAEVTGYNSPLMKDYRNLVAYHKKLVEAYNQLRNTVRREEPSTIVRVRMKSYENDLVRLEERKSDLESEMVAMNCCKSFSEMAAELNTNERILRYKLEAMRLRGEDIDRQELESYNRVFLGAI